MIFERAEDVRHLHAEWENIVGPEMAAYSFPSAVADGTVFIGIRTETEAAGGFFAHRFSECDVVEAVQDALGRDGAVVQLRLVPVEYANVIAPDFTQRSRSGGMSYSKLSAKKDRRLKNGGDPHRAPPRGTIY
jgi:hypothetical protein